MHIISMHNPVMTKYFKAVKQAVRTKLPNVWLAIRDYHDCALSLPSCSLSWGLPVISAILESVVRPTNSLNEPKQNRMLVRQSNSEV